MIRPSLLVTALFSATVLVSGLVAGTAVSPAAAQPEALPESPAHPWQYDHWPQRQPWQQSKPGAQPFEAKRATQAGFPAPVDPQDVYRLSATVDGRGWSVKVPNELTTAEFGKYVEVPVYALKSSSGPAATTAGATVKLTATSESDPAKSSTATCTVVER